MYLKLSTAALTLSLGALRGPAAVHKTSDCTEWEAVWEHPSLHLVFETRSCDWDAANNKVIGRWLNQEDRALRIEGRVWTQQPLSCTRGGIEVMFFYNTVPAGGYSSTDFTIQPKGTHLWVCAVER